MPIWFHHQEELQVLRTPTELVDVDTIETVDIPLRSGKRWRIRSRSLSKPGISICLCKGAEVRSGPHEGERRRDRGTTPLRRWERTTVDLSVGREGRTLREGKEEEEVGERSSTPLSGAFPGEVAPTRLERNTWGRCNRWMPYLSDRGCHLAPSLTRTSRVLTLNKMTPWSY